MTDATVFNRRVHTVLCELFPDRSFKLNESAGTIKSGELQFGLGNLYTDYKLYQFSDEKLREVICETFTNSFALVTGAVDPLPAEWEKAKPRLRVQLVHGKIASCCEDSLVFPFSKEVYSALVVDSEKGYAYIRRQDAEQWDQSVVDLQMIAEENLAQASPELQATKVPGVRGMMAIQTGDGYDAARVLLRSIRKMLISELMEGRGHEVIVGVPNRDFLIAWPSDAPEEFDSLMSETVAADAKRQSHPLTGTTLRVTIDSITPRGEGV